MKTIDRKMDTILNLLIAQGLHHMKDASSAWVGERKKLRMVKVSSATP